MKIRAIVMDVDGTLTDGSLHYASNGELFKTFSVRDGYAIKQILPMHGITPIIITGRQSAIVEKRCLELDIKYIVQNSINKKNDMLNMLKQLEISLDETAYIGDDINDIEAMELCGLKGCPGDADVKIKAVVDYISDCLGGRGAVRDFITYIISGQMDKDSE